VEGGLLDCGAVRHRGHLPELGEALERHLFRRYWRSAIPGCRAEALLQHACPELPAVLGLVDPQAALRYWEAAEAQGLAAAPLTLGDLPVDDGLLASLRTLTRQNH